ncbi:MAG: alkaline phosphatase D family protein [Kangiellaceae bacterium]|jgi:alkaline phosphatase D|nr:alkaline phosphatase D family protein [Kangiellaceae bacterium]
MKHFTRREFIKITSLGLGTAILSTGLTGCLSDDDEGIRVSFDHGVASGDPQHDKVIIWTRITAENNVPVNVKWEVFEAATNTLVVSGSTVVDSGTDHTLKVDIAGLTSGTRYRYRFKSNGVTSVTGNTATLPDGQLDLAKFAVVSCSNYTAGYFNVYREIANRTDINAVLHLGDYIYEYAMGGYATERVEELGRQLPDDNNTELFELEDYRKRYALYRSDGDLQSCHQNHPFIAVWDDHEVANDAYVDGAENHNDGEGDFSTRKMKALQAYFEWTPIRDRFAAGDESINRSFQYGDLLDLHMLDTRIQARDQAIDITDYIDSQTGQLDAQAFQLALTDSSRNLLGGEQLQWLTGQFAGSAAIWQVLGQQVVMGRMLLPAAIATQALSIADFITIASLAPIAAIYQRQQAGDPTLTAEELALLTPENLALLAANQALLTEQNIALVQLPSIPYNLDAWDGYAYERELLLGLALNFDINLVVLAGDTHNAWANNLKTINDEVVGVEFATASVSSPGLEEYLAIPNQATAAEYEAGITQLIGDLQYCNVFDRGYLTVEFTRQEATAEWIFIDTVFSNDYQVMSQRSHTLAVLPGSNNRQLVSA